MISWFWLLEEKRKSLDDWKVFLKHTHTGLVCENWLASDFGMWKIGKVLFFVSFLFLDFGSFIKNKRKNFLLFF